MAEKRMYVLVPYNISEIQKGIQAAHAIVEYSELMWMGGENGGINEKFDNYTDWVKNWKTIIVLNGGTTNDNKKDKWYGTLQQHRDRLKELEVKFTEFYEPDLNNALSAIAFVVDMEEDWMVLKYLQNEKLA